NFYVTAYTTVVDTLSEFSKLEFTEREEKRGLEEYMNCLREYKGEDALPALTEKLENMHC
ncbi:hypothetical protein, partial [Methylobacterium crusticola]|uniref:hypothetical protein n=1 Tax=Methylobacterium crusticola TaxID=1697972 RepID=UPI001EE2365C